MWVNFKYEMDDDVIGKYLISIFRNRMGAYGALFLGTAIITALVFPLMDAYSNYDNWNHDQNVFYLGFSSFFYSLAFSLVACSILFGRIPFILNTMTDDMWLPFSIPIFGVYLASYAIVTGCFYGTYKSYWWQGFNIICDYIYTLTSSYVIGTAFHVIFEVPFIYLERIIFPRIN